MTGLPFAAPPGHQPALPNNAKAAEQFARLLDALVVLDAEGSCRVTHLATRVGLNPQRLRQLLSTYMVAGSEALGPDAPFNLEWGTAAGSLGATEEDDAGHEGADVVHVVGSRRKGEWLVGDVGRRPVMVKDVATALLATRVMVEDDTVRPERKLVLHSLAAKLSEAICASVDAPAEQSATALHRAVQDRVRVRFRYLHPWTGESKVVDVEPYDVWRRRDRLVLDGGPELTTYDLGGISELVELPDSFVPPDLPPRELRTPRTRVVIAVPAQSTADRRLTDGWGGLVVGPVGDGRIDIAVELDGDGADPGVVERLGVLLLQLGAGRPPVRTQTTRRWTSRSPAGITGTHVLVRVV